METATITAPPRRSLTIAEFAIEAKARFGPDIAGWAFECPGCGTVSAATDFPEGCSDRVALAAVECIGRHVEGRGCDRIAYSLDPGPWLVTLASGAVVASFALADALSEPLRGAREIGGTGGAARADGPSAPPMAPPRALVLERGEGPWHRYPMGGGAVLLNLEKWDYRVALGEQESVLGFRTDSALRIMFVHAADNPPYVRTLPEQIGEAARYIDEHELPVSERELADAFWLIANATDPEPAAAAAPPGPELRPYWTAEEGWTNSIGCSCHISPPCSPCESMQDCELCGHAVSVPECDMAAHLAEVHGETGAAAAAESEV